MTIRGGGDPTNSMAFEPRFRMGPPPRSFAADAHGCITSSGAGAYLVARGGCPRSGAVPWSREWALFLFLPVVSTGATFLWCRRLLQAAQPNLVLAIVADGGVPTFGLGARGVRCSACALVELSAGALMMAGVLVAPGAGPTFGPFDFLGAALGEKPRWGRAVLRQPGGACSPAAPEPRRRAAGRALRPPRCSRRCPDTHSLISDSGDPLAGQPPILHRGVPAAGAPGPRHDAYCSASCGARRSGRTGRNGRPPCWS